MHVLSSAMYLIAAHANNSVGNDDREKAISTFVGNGMYISRAPSVTVGRLSDSTSGISSLTWASRRNVDTHNFTHAGEQNANINMFSGTNRPRETVKGRRGSSVPAPDGSRKKCRSHTFPADIRRALAFSAFFTPAALLCDVASYKLLSSLLPALSHYPPRDKIFLEPAHEQRALRQFIKRNYVNRAQMPRTCIA